MSQEKIAIVTDSTSDLEDQYLKEKAIYVLPLKIIYPDKEYHDRVDIQPEEIYSRFPEEIPKTSMPGLGEVIELFEKLRSEGYNKILSMHISSGLSGTFDTVRMAAKQFTDIQIEVMDSKALSLGLGFCVDQAAKLKEAGCVFDEMVEKVKKVRDEMKVFFVVKSLEYLRKGGRIGLIEGTLGDFFNLKPIVSINEEGKYFTYAKVRGRKKSLDEMVEIISGYIKGKTVNLAVMHGGAEEEGQEVKEKLLQVGGFNLKEFFWGQIGPSMVVHTGPGLVGVAFHEIE